MKANVKGSDLAGKVSLVAGNVKGKNSVAMMNNVLVEFRQEEKDIVMMSSDLELSTKVIVYNVDVIEGGSMIVPADEFARIILSCGDNVIEIEQEKVNGAVKISWPNAEYYLDVSSGEFPDITKKGDGVVSFNINYPVFLDMLNFVKNAISLDSSRFVLNGACFDISKNILKVVSTDGHRMSYIEGDIVIDNESCEKHSIIVPTNVINQLLKIPADLNVVGGIMKVLILCGGKGTRLRPFTYVLPKPLFPFNDKVVLHNLIDHLSLQGFEDLTLSLGYKGSFIKNYCESENLSVKYIVESSPLGTVGPIKLMQDQEFDNLLLLNGDIITTMNFRKMEKEHCEQNSDITIACKEYCRKIPFGDIIHDENNNIIRINEKPVHKSEVSIGISIISKSVLDLIAVNESMDVPGLVALAISKGLRVKCYHLLPNEQWNALEHFKQFNDEKIESIEEI